MCGHAADKLRGQLTLRLMVVRCLTLPGVDKLGGQHTLRLTVFYIQCVRQTWCGQAPRPTHPSSNGTLHTMFTTNLARTNSEAIHVSSNSILHTLCEDKPGADKLRGHGEERLLDVGGALGARLQEGDAQRLRVLLRRRAVHHLILAVALVT